MKELFDYTYSYWNNWKGIVMSSLLKHHLSERTLVSSSKDASQMLNIGKPAPDNHVEIENLLILK